MSYDLKSIKHSQMLIVSMFVGVFCVVRKRVEKVGIELVLHIFYTRKYLEIVE
jgi:hypothetical protein